MNEFDYKDQKLMFKIYGIAKKKEKTNQQFSKQTKSISNERF